METLFFQDDIKVTRRFTANLGFRYERFGDISDAMGRNGNIDPNLINTNPPAAGSLQGYVVPSNYTGPMPAGVTKLNNKMGYSGAGQNTLNPRAGFAWELPGTDRFVLRGGYGVYHDQTTGQPFIQLLTDAPFAVLNQLASTQNASATLANPFPPAVTPPIFPVYSPTTKLSTTIIGPYYRPPTIQQYSLGMQARVARDMVLTVSYSGARGVHLNEERTINQAGFASASNPINGVTTNTVANIQQRVPYQGFTASGMNDIYSNGESWYNSLGASLEKRFSHGLQFLGILYLRPVAFNRGQHDCGRERRHAGRRPEQAEPNLRAGQLHPRSALRAERPVRDCLCFTIAARLFKPHWAAGNWGACSPCRPATGSR